MSDLCIKLGQEYPEGVLQLLDTKTVLVFPSDLNMMAAYCHFAAAMAWHGKPGKLHIQPLMTMQVRDYITTRSSYHSGVQVPVQGEGVDAQPLPRKAYLDNGPGWN